jgi:hypothetical protein
MSGIKFKIRAINSKWLAELRDKVRSSLIFSKPQFW